MKKKNPLATEERKLHHKQEVCYICKKEFSTGDAAFNKKYYKVRGHCHYSGKYRRAAHDICNLRYKHQKKFL